MERIEMPTAEEQAPFIVSGNGEFEVHGLLAGDFGIFAKQSLGATSLRTVFYVAHVPSKYVMGEFNALGAARRARDLAARLMPECLVGDEPLVASNVIRKAWLQFGFEELDEIDDEGSVILKWTGKASWQP